MSRCLAHVALIQVSAFLSLARTAPLQAVVTCKIGQFLPSDTQVHDISPVFLSDDLIALLVRAGPSRIGSSKILVMRWAGSHLQLVATTDKANEGDEIFAVSGNRMLISARFHKYLYASDLKQRWEVPIRILSTSFPRSGAVENTTRVTGERSESERF